MTAELWTRIRALVEQAMMLPPGQRAEFLSTQTADPLVLDEARQLLGFEQEASRIFNVEAQPWSFEAAAAAIHPEAHAETSLAGLTLGNYRLIEEIGRGGMGAVYLAERSDGAYQQRVALKILQEAIFSPQLVQRFADERQNLARLSHPGIARLLDGGVTPDGRPYLVLDYVDGIPIDRYCDEHRLELDARLRLFLKVAEAVQSAHQQLVLHLDIKPANILVTPEGEPRLLDFGISRVLTEGLGGPGTNSRQVEATLRLLTPKYASPEQAAGQPLGVGSDVFSLATLLYRLLTGRLPYNIEGASPLEAARMIREENPVAPSKAAADQAIAAQLRGDLDTILLQALRKEPPRRYGTVVELIDDLRRYLAHQPVRAHADSFRYRSSKFLRRNRAAVVAAACVLVILLVSAAAIVRYAIVARRQQQLAERRFQDVRNLAHSYIFDLDPQLTDIPGTVKVRALVLHNALTYLDSMSAEKGGDPDLMRELGKGYMRASLVQSRVGVPSLTDEEGARQSLLKSLDLERKVFERNPADLDQRNLLINNLRLLADHARSVNDLKTSEDYALQGWNLAPPLIAAPPRAAPLDTLMRLTLLLAQNRGAQSEGATLGDPLGAIPWLDRLHQLILSYAALPPAQQIPYTAENFLRHELIIRASVLRQLDRKPEARAMYEEAIPVSQRMVGTSLSGTVGDMVLHYTYAEFLLETHDPARAAQIAPPAKAVLLAEDGANRVQVTQVADLLALHARIDLERGALALGKAETQQCLDAFESLYREKPEDAATNDQMAASLFDIGKEPNLDLPTQRRLFLRGLAVIQPELLRAPEDLQERTTDAEGRLRLVQALQAKGISSESAPLIDQAEADLKLILAHQPNQPEATQMLAQAEALRAGKKVE